ncbi:uncharacterized protein LOC105698959, partial [Orussus abietinus]|uniref:uncharacterized protein LOC105698959 n=1 Tax=Orussus abietinus TaxID=222816 RepID=UPI000C71622F
DRIFDVTDINAEIERAKSTLEAADTAFQRHAVKFDNDDEFEETLSLAQRIERNRKLAAIDPIEKPKLPPPVVKWSRYPETDEEPTRNKAMQTRQARINSLIAENAMTDNAPPPQKGGSFLKRKKSVSF